MFEDDAQIQIFLTLQQGFSSSNIDEDAMDESQQQMSQNEKTITAEVANQMLHPTIFYEKNMQELK